MVEATDTAPDLTGTNPFELLAYVLFKVRHSLEDEDSNRAPRWVRIARARSAQAESDFIGKGVKLAVNGFAESVSYMAELVLDIRELLIQTDAAKALAEASLDLIDAATDDNFVNGVRAIVGEQPADNPLSGVGDVLNDIDRYLGYIPEPDDLTSIGHELYLLLAIEQLRMPRGIDNKVNESELTPSTENHVDIDRSGKLRLLQWAFGEGLTTHGLGPMDRPEEESSELFRFGNRRLWQTGTGNLPQQTVGIREEDGSEDAIFEFFYDADREETVDNRTLDIVEAHELLEKMGYVEPAVTELQRKAFGLQLARRLRRFQAVNGLPMTGELDNNSINRLMNMNFETKNLERAKPFDSARIPGDIDEAEDIVRVGEFELVNPDADHPEAENIQFPNNRPGYPYYIAGALLPATGPAQVPMKGGWIRDAGGDLIQGFVALRSRRLVTGDDGNRWYEPDYLSEGEAANGRFFFSGRSVEPWIAGRRHAPRSDALFDAHNGVRPIFGAISRMYQWVPINNKPNGYILYVTASVLRRSLYTERVVDQGRICVEFYGPDFFTGDLGKEREAANKLGEAHDAAWFPQNTMVEAVRTLADAVRKQIWTLQKIADVRVPDEAVAILIILEGKFINELGWDTDAYFDDVRLYWEYKKEESAGVI